MDIKKLFLVPVMAIMLLFGAVLSAHAYINGEQDLYNKIQKLQELRAFDVTSLINKGDLIGYRLDDFNRARQTYNSSINYAIDQLNQIRDDIYKFQNMEGLSEQEKTIQIQKLYQDANKVISDLNSATSAFVYLVKNPMPTLTYQRFEKKFWNYYYSLGF